MVDGGIGRFNPAKRLARMARLTAGLLARRFAKVADPRRLLEPVAGGWLAALLLCSTETALQFRNTSCQRRDLGTTQHVLGTQSLNDRFAAPPRRAVVRRLCRRAVPSTR